MANEMSEKGFIEGVKKLYKDSGEFDIDSKIETLCDTARKMNKENNPFYLRAFFEKIQEEMQNGTTIEELVSDSRKTYRDD